MFKEVASYEFYLHYAFKICEDDDFEEINKIITDNQN